MYSNFHLGRYIVRYTVRNLVLWRSAKRDFWPYFGRYINPQIKNFEYVYPHSNVFLQFRLRLERCKPHKAAGHPKIYDVIYDVKVLPTVYHRIYCRKFWRYPIRRRVTKSSALESKLVLRMVNIYSDINELLAQAQHNFTQIFLLWSILRIAQRVPLP